MEKAKRLVREGMEQGAVGFATGMSYFPNSWSDTDELIELCKAANELGGVYGPYSDRWFATRYDTDIEHMVARAEAHDSGLCAANRRTRRRFATDTLNLTLAAPRVNRYEKRAKDAAEWLPDHNRCWFAERVIAVRQKYGLTIDRAEAASLDAVLAGCGRP